MATPLFQNATAIRGQKTPSFFKQNATTETKCFPFSNRSQFRLDKRRECGFLDFVIQSREKLFVRGDSPSLSQHIDPGSPSHWTLAPIFNDFSSFPLVLGQPIHPECHANDHARLTRLCLEALRPAVEPRE